MLTINEVPLSQSALLVVDAQDSFKVDPKWERRNNRDFERNVASPHRRTSRRRASGVLLPSHRWRSGLRARQRSPPTHGFHSCESPASRCCSRTRETRSRARRFKRSSLALGVRRLAITGIQMEQCCETTARVAADLGYAVDFVIDATMTFPIRNWDSPGEELGVEAVEERTVYALANGSRAS